MRDDFSLSLRLRLRLKTSSTYLKQAPTNEFFVQLCDSILDSNQSTHDIC